MIPTPKHERPLIRESRIIHKSPILHSLTQFVTEDAVALMFNLYSESFFLARSARASDEAITSSIFSSTSPG